MKIFWSWQSDTHQPTGRYFVLDVLNALVTELNGLNGLDGAEEADRPVDEPAEDLTGIEVDHGMHGMAGHAPIAQTILGKIENAAIFAADLTPIATTKGGKRVPNPNVMIELGYAVKSLGHERLLLIANQAEGAKLDAMPFDLKHWSGPIFYKLDRGASPERIAEEAEKLKARLKPHIEASLKVAARDIKAARRSAHRQPELEVVLDDEMEMPIEVRQTVRNLGVKSLEEIKDETPLQKLPAAKTTSDLLAARSRFSGTFASFAPPPKPEHWTREETEGYNAMVEGYYQKYAAYLTEQTDFSRMVLRSFQVKLILENNGTLPATNIDAVLTFPTGVTLHDFGEFPEAPEAPSPPPLKPLGPGQSWVTQVSQKYDFPSLTTPFQLRSTHIYPDRRQVRFDLKDLKHHERAMIDAFIVSFTSADDIGDFDVDYVITANEPVDPIQGKVHFEIVQSDDVEAAGGAPTR